MQAAVTWHTWVTTGTPWVRRAIKASAMDVDRKRKFEPHSAIRLRRWRVACRKPRESARGWRHPDALFAATDDLGIRAIEALRQLGFRVPHDLKVAGMGGTSGAARCNPPMTTLAPSITDAIDALAHRLCTVPGNVQVPVPLPNGSLIIRASSLRDG